MLALEMHLIECSDKTILVPHGSLLGDVERRKCRRGLRRREGRVSLRRRGAKHAWAPAALLSRRRALWRPWIVANPGAHGSVLAIVANVAVLLRRAAVPATPALALDLALAAATVAARRRPCCCRSRLRVGCVYLQSWLWQREHGTCLGWCS